MSETLETETHANAQKILVGQANLILNRPLEKDLLPDLNVIA